MSSYLRMKCEDVAYAADVTIRLNERYHRMRDRVTKRRLLRKANRWRRLFWMRQLTWDEYDPGVVEGSFSIQIYPCRDKSWLINEAKRFKMAAEGAMRHGQRCMLLSIEDANFLFSAGRH